jgi:hypothetical protein
MMMLEPDCHCCQESIRELKQVWHCKFCWDKWHNGERDSDFTPNPPKDFNGINNAHPQ